MIRKNRYNLSQAEYEVKMRSKAELMAKKEKILVNKPWHGYCDNKDHPLFSIKVDYNKKWAACYYCSKLWILNDD